MGIYGIFHFFFGGITTCMTHCSHHPFEHVSFLCSSSEPRGMRWASTNKTKKKGFRFLSSRRREKKVSRMPKHSPAWWWHKKKEQVAVDFLAFHQRHSNQRTPFECPSGWKWTIAIWQLKLKNCCMNYYHRRFYVRGSLCSFIIHESALCDCRGAQKKETFHIDTKKKALMTVIGIQARDIYRKRKCKNMKHETRWQHKSMTLQVPFCARGKGEHSRVWMDSHAMTPIVGGRRVPFECYESGGKKTTKEFLLFLSRELINLLCKGRKKCALASLTLAASKALRQSSLHEIFNYGRKKKS